MAVLLSGKHIASEIMFDKNAICVAFDWVLTFTLSSSGSKSELKYFDI